MKRKYICRPFVLILIIIFSMDGTSFAANEIPSSEKHDRPLGIGRLPDYRYTYIDQEHTFKQHMINVGIIYGVSWIVYPISQHEYISNGSWKTYQRNFGHFSFDKDAPFWNWFLHPIVGAQYYLFYRSNGYTRDESVLMSFISSALFEITIEIYTEPSSIQDLYQTPVLGAVLGVGLEKLSMYLLNTGNSFAKMIGHILNPYTLFGFYKGKIKITPAYNREGIKGLMIYADF